MPDCWLHHYHICRKAVSAIDEGPMTTVPRTAGEGGLAVWIARRQWQQGTYGAARPPNLTVLLSWPLAKGWGSLWLKGRALLLSVGNGTRVHPGYKQDQSPQPSCLHPENLLLLGCSQLELRSPWEAPHASPWEASPSLVYVPPSSYPWSILFFWSVQVPHFLQETFLCSPHFRGVRCPQVSQTLSSPHCHNCPPGL